MSVDGRRDGILDPCADGVRQAPVGDRRASSGPGPGGLELRRDLQQRVLASGWPTSCTPVGSPSSPKPDRQRDRRLAGDVEQRRERRERARSGARSAIGSSPQPLQLADRQRALGQRRASAAGRSRRRTRHAARERLQLRERGQVRRPTGACGAMLEHRARQRLDLVLGRRPARRAARRSRSRARPPGRRRAMNRPSASGPGSGGRGLDDLVAERGAAARPPRAARARTPGRRRRRAGSRRSSRSRSRPGSRAHRRSRTARPGAAPRSRRRPRSRRARRAAARSRPPCA